MRKITRDIVEAFMHGEEVSIRNSSTATFGCVADGTGIIRLFLHGNAIAQMNLGHGGLPLRDTLQVTDAGWSTRTTRDRLNGLPGVRVHQAKGQQFLNGEPWDGDWTYVVPAVSVKRLAGNAFEVHAPEAIPMPFPNRAVAEVYATLEASNRGLPVRL